MERAQGLILLEPGISLGQESMGSVMSLVLWLGVLACRGA